MEIPKIKSVGILAIKKYVIEHFGEDTYKKILDYLNDDDRQILESLLTASQWYPEETCRRIVLSMEAVLSSYGKPEEIFYDMGHKAALSDIPNFYKPLIRLLDANFAFKVTTKIWRLYHTHGELRTEQIDKNSAYVSIVNFPTPYKPFCWNTAGYIQGVVELVGFKLTRPVKEIECVLEGGRWCTFLVAWR